MEPFAQRKAAADARRDSSDNIGDLVGCLSAWPATAPAAPEVVDVLLRAGAELRPFDGRTALHAALGNGHEEVATALVAAASPDIVSTALQLARANDFGPIARRIEARIRPAS